MHCGLKRARRVAVTALLGAGAVGGLVVTAAGSAGAATTMTITPTAVSATYGTALDQVLTATESANTTAADTVDWTLGGNVPAGLSLQSSSTTIASGADSTTNALVGTTTALPGSYAATVTADDITANVTTTQTVTITVANAPVNQAGGGAVTLTSSAPQPSSVVAGGTSQAAASWTFELGADYASGQYLLIDIGPNGHTQCQSSTDYVEYAGTPTVTVATNGTSETQPTFTATLATQAGDLSGCQSDALELTLGDTSTSGSTPWTVTVSGITYNVGSATTPGTIGATGGFFYASGSDYAETVQPNATVTNLSVTANSPAVSLNPNAVDQPISNVVLTETQPGAVPAGTVSVTLSAGTWDTAGQPAVTVSPTSSGAQAGSVSLSNSNQTLQFPVTTASSSSAATYTLSGLVVDAPKAPGPVTATVTEAVSGGGTTTLASGLVLYNVASSQVIYGQTADGTAVAEMESQWPATTSSNCPGTTVGGTISQSRFAPVVLATDTNYPDALAASYLAGYLGTGILLTPPHQVSQVTLNALRVEGITNVYIVGGPDVISNAVVTQLQNTPVYQCRGTATSMTLLGTAQDLSVQRIAGQTLYDTAEQIAEFPPATNVGLINTPGAYAGQYNTTSGNESSAPSSSSSSGLRTAILATGTGFQDAESASALAYYDQLPVLLTTPNALSSQAQSAMTSLGIQQVIVMGGPIAISDAVVTSVEDMGISVIRIAGQDYTQTATELADYLVNPLSNTSGQAEGLGVTGTATVDGSPAAPWDPSHTLVVARGDFYSDGLAGAEVTGRNTEPLLLTKNPSTVGSYLTTFLQGAGSPAGIDGAATTNANLQISSLTILGGPLAVNDSTIQTMLADLGS